MPIRVSKACRSLQGRESGPGRLVAPPCQPGAPWLSRGCWGTAGGLPNCHCAPYRAQHLWGHAWALSAAPDPGSSALRCSPVYTRRGTPSILSIHQPYARFVGTEGAIWPRDLALTGEMERTQLKAQVGPAVRKIRSHVMAATCPVFPTASLF